MPRVFSLFLTSTDGSCFHVGAKADDADKDADDEEEVEEEEDADTSDILPKPATICCVSLAPERLAVGASQTVDDSSKMVKLVWGFVCTSNTGGSAKVCSCATALGPEREVEVEEEEEEEEEMQGSSME